MKALRSLFIGLALISFSLLISSCAKKGVVTQSPSPTPEVTKKTSQKDSRRYLKEGFISAHTFRVVLLIPQGREDSEKELRARGERRITGSMQAYVLNRTETIDQNRRAHIVGLAQRGTLTKTGEVHNGNEIFYFEVTEGNLKRRLSKGAPR